MWRQLKVKATKNIIFSKAITSPNLQECLYQTNYAKEKR